MKPEGLSAEQVRRYSRHILLPDVGGVGQKRFLAASVIVTVGPGRAGEVAALAYLAAAGVGRLLLAGPSDDPLEVAEVRDGILFAKSDVGRRRIDAISRRIAAINPDVSIAPHRGAGDGPTAFRLADQDPGLDPSWQPGRPEESVADALVTGGLRAARTLIEILSHEPS